MDQDGSLNISFNEWRDFLLLAPGDNLHDIIKYWRHSTVSNMLMKNTSQRLLLRSSFVLQSTVWPFYVFGSA